MAEIAITDMTLVMDRPGPNGVRLLAVFDVKVPGVQIRGAALLQHRTGSLFMAPATHRSKQRGIVGASVTGWRLKRAVVRAAHAAAARERPDFPPLVLYPARALGDPLEAPLDDDVEAPPPSHLTPRRHRVRRDLDPNAGLYRSVGPQA